MKRPTYYLTLCLSWLLFSGCGGPPGNNPLLEEARSEFWAAQNDPRIAENAPVALKEAEESLRNTEDLWRNEVDDEWVSHHAYLTRQRIRIAEEKADLAVAEREVEKAEVERQAVMLQVREEQAVRAETEARKAQDDARRAERDAETAQLEADQANLEARKEARDAEIARDVASQAIADAEALADRVADLEARKTERGLVLTLSDILFDFDRSTLKPGGHRAIDELAAFLNDYPERTLIIEGFTDAIGTHAYNLDLSERRAEAVESALLANGIAARRIRTRGYGEEYPVAGNTDEAGRQLNRRVEVVISDETGQIPER